VNGVSSSKSSDSFEARPVYVPFVPREFLDELDSDKLRQRMAVNYNPPRTPRARSSFGGNNDPFDSRVDPILWTDWRERMMIELERPESDEGDKTPVVDQHSKHKVDIGGVILA
jgi:hypothetical protein